MSLRWTTALIIAVTVVGLSAATYGVASTIVDRRFSDLEEEYARRDVDRAVNAVQSEIDQVTALETDWARWDDTYSFMANHNQAYLSSNLTPDIVQQLNLDVFVFISPDGQVVVQRSRDDERAAANIAALQRALGLEQLPQGPALDALQVSTVVSVAPDPAVVVVQPILTSSGEGPARGVLLMARYLDEARLAALGETTQLNLSLPAPAEAPALSGPRAFATRTLSDSRLAAFGLLPAAPNTRPIEVRVDIDRDIAEQGTLLTRDVSLTILGFGLLFAALIFALFERAVLRRMSRLGAALAGVGSAADLAARVPGGGRDEIGRLAGEINGMLGALQRSEGRYRQLVSSAGDGIFVVHNGEIAFSNDAGAVLLGLPRPTLLEGQRLSTFFAGAERDSVEARLSEPGERAVPVRGTIIQAGGAQRPVELNITPLASEAGRAVQVVARDLSERLREEDARRALERRVEETQRLESLGLLAGGIAHDFNNLMMGVMGNASLARLHAGDPTAVAGALEEIERTTQRASDLTRQLLAYAGRGKLMVTAIDLSELAHETAELMRPVLTRNAALEVDTAPGLPAIEADATQIRQVVLNLLTNASDALGDRRGTIRVRTSRRTCSREELAALLAASEAEPGEYVFVEVSDTGAGIASEVRDRIFDPFYSTKGPGRGLGLAAVLGIVRAHGGGVELRSVPGQGSTLVVLFPAVASVPPGRRSDAAADPPTRMSGTVLVVDDEASLRRLLRALLEEFGFSVLTAANGRECLDTLHGGKGVDLVILDLTMPGMNGHEALRAIRADLPRLPVIIISGHSSETLAPEVAADRYTRFLQKPFDPASLFAAIAGLQGAPAA